MASHSTRPPLSCCNISIPKLFEFILGIAVVVSSSWAYWQSTSANPHDADVPKAIAIGSGAMLLIGAAIAPFLDETGRRQLRHLMVLPSFSVALKRQQSVLRLVIALVGLSAAGSLAVAWSLMNSVEVWDGWMGLGWYGGLLLAYLVYLRANPLAALGGMLRGLLAPVSDGRALLVGIVTTVILAVLLEQVEEWMAWLGLIVGVLVGHASRTEPNLARAAAIGLRRVARGGKFVLLAGLVVAGVFVAIWGLNSLKSAVGVVGLLLIVIVFQLQRLIDLKEPRR